MKLVEILARELEEWPVAKSLPLRQANDNSLYVSAEHTRGKSTNYLDIFVSKSENQMDDVTSTQWEAERARIAELDRGQYSLMTEEAEDWRNNCQKQYEQELWDKVAEIVFSTAFVDGLTGWGEEGFKDVAGRAMTAADAFMAERAKRMKGVK